VLSLLRPARALVPITFVDTAHAPLRSITATGRHLFSCPLYSPLLPRHSVKLRPIREHPLVSLGWPGRAWLLLLLLLLLTSSVSILHDVSGDCSICIKAHPNALTLTSP